MIRWIDTNLSWTRYAVIGRKFTASPSFFGATPPACANNHEGQQTAGGPTEKRPYEEPKHGRAAHYMTSGQVKCRREEVMGGIQVQNRGPSVPHVRHSQTARPGSRNLPKGKWIELRCSEKQLEGSKLILLRRPAFWKSTMQKTDARLQRRNEYKLDPGPFLALFFPLASEISKMLFCPESGGASRLALLRR